jgi:hypothetical protein
VSTILDPTPFIEAPIEKISFWNDALAQYKLEPKVGLVWKGNPNHVNDHHRSIPIKELLPFLIPRIRYFCLQKEITREDKATIENLFPIEIFEMMLNDFSETAAICQNLDLVITVDTSVAHLSASLGKNTWVILPHVPDWRWLLVNESSPWYKSVKLFRQESISNWSGVLENLKSCLNQFQIEFTAKISQ